MLLWKIFFSDKDGLVTKTNLDTDILEGGRLDLPRLPVAVIINIIRDSSGARAVMTQGRPYYYLVDKKEWWAGSLSGLHNYIDEYRGDAVILRGGMISNDRFPDIMRNAFLDPEVASVSQSNGMQDPLGEND